MMKMKRFRIHIIEKDCVTDKPLWFANLHFLLNYFRFVKLSRIQPTIDGKPAGKPSYLLVMAKVHFHRMPKDVRRRNKECKRKMEADAL